MKYIIFEDNKFANLFPLNVLRASFDIKTGVFSNKQRIINHLSDKTDVILFVRNELQPYLKAKHSEEVNTIPKEDSIFLNGRIIFTERLLNWIQNDMSMNSYLKNNNTIVVAKISSDEIMSRKDLSSFCLDEKYFEGLKDINNIGFNFEALFDEISYPWDVLKLLDLTLGFDLSYLLEKFDNFQKNEETSEEDANSYVSNSAKVYPGVVLDTVSGEIVIDDNAVVEPLCYLKGPIYIGKNSLVKSGSKIYGPCSIGWGSKVSGELSGVLFHSCVNKQHDGFIGNTYAAPFVNFGADTVTSNLKNNYSKVRVNHLGKSINTGMQFLGSIVGDHTKFGINTMLNTGTICGIYSNVAGGGFPEKFIDSFTWNLLGKESTKYRIEEALETAKIVMKRRGFEMIKEYEDLVRFVYEK